MLEFFDFNSPPFVTHRPCGGDDHQTQLNGVRRRKGTV